MIEDKEIAKLSRSLFWDVPQDSSNIQRIVNENPDWMIERAFEYGAMQDVRRVLAWYGNEKATRVLCSAESLAKETVGFACALFDLNKTDFKCYNYKRSNPIYY
jgi:hypothetical protein